MYIHNASKHGLNFSQKYITNLDLIQTCLHVYIVYKSVYKISRVYMYKSHFSTFSAKEKKHLRAHCRRAIKTKAKLVLHIYSVNKRSSITCLFFYKKNKNKRKKKEEKENRKWCEKLVKNIKPSRPAVNRTRSANSPICFRNSCKPGRSKTVT